MPFFSWSWVVMLLFFSFLFTSFFLFFFFWSYAVFSSSSLFGVRIFSFFILRVAKVVLPVFGLFSPLLIFFFFSFRCWTFSFSFLVGAEHVLLVFGLFSLFLIFWGLCVFSLSLSPWIAWTSRSEIDFQLFLAASLIVSVESWYPNRKPYHERCAQVLAPNNHMYHIHN